MKKRIALCSLMICSIYAQKKEIQERNLKKTTVAEIVHYEVQDQFKPQNLIGISNEQIDDHWKLYKGYVNQVN